jgi:hypothetical protein
LRIAEFSDSEQAITQRGQAGIQKDKIIDDKIIFHPWPAA